MKCPVDYMAITQKFSKKHNGLDLGWYNIHNRAILSCDDGVVIYNRYQTTGGYVIKIKHDNGFTSIYGHLLKDSQRVHEGDKVKKGQQIANMGASGKVSGEHLHFSLLYKEAYVDPCKYINLYDNQDANLKTKLLINHVKHAKGIPSEPLLVHNQPNFNSNSIVKNYKIYNGDIVEYYGTKNGLAIIDNCRKYYTSKKYLK